jgi:DNA gyrase inhibitor GyrI
MEAFNVRIVRLEPMRVASAHGFGPSPETEAWDKLISWTKLKGLLEDLGVHRFFGFNNPNPSPGSPNYGYEQWMTIDASVEAEAECEVKIKEYPAGLYAVARCKGVDNIFPTWQKLVAWQEDSRHHMVHRQCLEECLKPQLFLAEDGQVPFDELVFDLYLPIAE